MPETAKPVQLAPQTLAAYQNYIREAELAMEPPYTESNPFLWSDSQPELSKRILDGFVPAELWSGTGPLHVANGLIHDWIGAAFAADVAVRDTLTLIQDYNNHKDIYQPEVIDSRLLDHHDHDFHILLRLRKKKVITVVLETEHDVHYSEISQKCWSCRSFTTSIREVEHAGKSKEVIMPPDSGYGFIWRLNSYWRFEERDGGTWLQCRAISLSRDVPKGLAWIIEPIIRKLPRESLIHTLEATRLALTHPRIPAVSSA